MNRYKLQIRVFIAKNSNILSTSKLNAGDRIPIKKNINDKNVINN